MICNNCDRSIKDENKICPYCGFVLERKEISQTEHHNYAHETALARNLRMTDEIVNNYGFSYKSVADASVLFTNPGFIFINVIVYMIYDFTIYYMLHSITWAFIISLVCMIFKILLEMIFYKTNDKWYRAVLPIVNVLNLYKLYLRDYKSVYNIIYTVWFFSTVWIVMLTLVFLFLTGAYFNMVMPICGFFLQLQIYIISFGFIVYTFKTFFCIGYRYSFNPYKVMFLPIVYIPRIALSPRYFYHPDKPV